MNKDFEAHAMQDSAADTLVAAVAHKVSTAGGVTAVIGGLTANDIAAYGGLVIGFIGLVVQVCFKWRADRRDTELLAARLAELRDDDAEQ